MAFDLIVKTYNDQVSGKRALYAEYSDVLSLVPDRVQNIASEALRRAKRR